MGAVVGELGFVFVDLRELGDTLDGGGLAEVVELVKVVEQVKDVRAMVCHHVVHIAGQSIVCGVPVVQRLRTHVQSCGKRIKIHFPRLRVTTFPCV